MEEAIALLEGAVPEVVVVVLLEVLAFLAALEVLEVRLVRMAFPDKDVLQEVLDSRVGAWAFLEVLPNLQDFLHEVRVGPGGPGGPGKECCLG